MWLIMTALAAIITTVIWHVKARNDKYKLGLLSMMFWGATIMWLVDHIMAYVTKGGPFFEVSLNAALLGGSVIALALVAWLIVLLVSNPKGILKRVLKR